MVTSAPQSKPFCLKINGNLIFLFKFSLLVFVR